MARKGRVGRGLIKKRDAVGKPVWYVRLWHAGKMRQFGHLKQKPRPGIFTKKPSKSKELVDFPPNAIITTAT